MTSRLVVGEGISGTLMVGVSPRRYRRVLLDLIEQLIALRRSPPGCQRLLRSVAVETPVVVGGAGQAPPAT